MKNIPIPFGSESLSCAVPEQTDILAMAGSTALEACQDRIADSLAEPIGTPIFRTIIRQKLDGTAEPTAVIVISDNTRPVPYTGEQGILWPLVDQMISEGVKPKNITVLVATGTHRALTTTETKKMIDARVLDLGIAVINHDCKDEESLTYLGTTVRGTEVYIDRVYLEADIKILTGLVESHFMAGASGGRKSICPGLIGEDTTFIFHGPKMLADPNSDDLVLEGNPCHEEALEVAQKAGADFIVNVVLNNDLDVTGVFSGDLQKAHEAAVASVKKHVGVPYEKEYDVVITHGGFVGINHYQVAKAGSAAKKVVKPGGYVIIAADNSDGTNPVGAITYRTTLQLMKLIGASNFIKLICSDDWSFIPEQWQVQKWAELFEKIPLDHFYYYSPQFTSAHYELCPGIDGSRFSEGETVDLKVASFIAGSIADAAKRLGKGIDELEICYLTDGPYGIPVKGML